MTAIIQFEKFKDQSHASVSVSDDRNTLTFELFSKRDVKNAVKDLTEEQDLSDLTVEPSWSVIVTDVQSSDVMQYARGIYDGLPKTSKLQAFASDFQHLSTKGKKSTWGFANNDDDADNISHTDDHMNDNAEDNRKDKRSGKNVIHPEEYIQYAIYAYLEPMYKKTDAVIVKLMAEVGMQLLDGKKIDSWFPDEMMYNGTFLRHGSEISGKLPNTIKQLRNWNPTDMQWR